jgi:hypothetical protein
MKQDHTALFWVGTGFVKWGFIARVHCAFGVVTTLAACTDGYPQRDVQVLSPVTMSQKQRVEAMNAVGKQHYLGERWRYKFNEACELKVTTGRWFSVKHSDWVPLASVQVVRSFDRSDKTHDLFLQPKDPPSANATSVPLLTGAQWEDAIQQMNLAQFMQRNCVQSG